MREREAGSSKYCFQVLHYPVSLGGNITSHQLVSGGVQRYLARCIQEIAYHNGLTIGANSSWCLLSKYNFPFHGCKGTIFIPLRQLKMDYLLHIDTSTDTARYGLSANGELLEAVNGISARDHATTINLQIAALLLRHGIGLAQLAAIVVDAGPGSYTGLRIGMATAKGYCYGLDIPLLAHNKLELLARQCLHLHGAAYQNYVCIRLARAGEYFACILQQSGAFATEPVHMTHEQLNEALKSVNESIIITDKASEEVGKYAEKNYVQVAEEVDMKDWAFWAYSQYKCNNTVNLSTAEPFYLKQVYTHKAL